MLLSMAKDPVVLAMSNPDPEIDYKLAVETRSDLIMATGRSDSPTRSTMFWDSLSSSEGLWMCELPRSLKV